MRALRLGAAKSLAQGHTTQATSVLHVMWTNYKAHEFDILHSITSCPRGRTARICMAAVQTLAFPSNVYQCNPFPDTVLGVEMFNSFILTKTS